MIRICLLIYLASIAFALDIDPFTDVDTTRNAQLLTLLSKEFKGISPADPVLIKSEMALVNLALDGDLSDAGGNGPIWRQRARELRDLRIAAGVKAATFEDAIPDLWIDALDGRTAACIAALDRFADAAQKPHSRALRCVATKDWRELRKLNDLTTHERIALAMAYSACGMSGALQKVDHSDFPTFAWARLLASTVGFTHEGNNQALQEAVHLTSLLAQSKSLSPNAVKALTAYQAACGNRVDPSAINSPQNLIEALQSNETWRKGEVILSGWRFLDAATDGQTGLRSANGEWKLISAPDWATANKLQLFIGAWRLHAFIRYQYGVPEMADELSKPIIDGDTGILGFWHHCLSNPNPDTKTANSLLDAIDREATRPYGGLPPMLLADAVRIIQMRAKGIKEHAQKTMEKLVTAHLAAEPQCSLGWRTIGSTLSDLGHLELATEDLTHAASLDPWSPELENYAQASRTPAAKSGKYKTDWKLIESQWAKMPWRMDLGVKIFSNLYEVKKYKEALAVADKIEALDPNNEQIGRRRGGCLKNLNRLDEAITVWKQYLNTSDDFDTIFVNLDVAEAYESKGDLEQAEKYYKEASNSGQNSAMVEYATFLSKNSRVPEAIVLIDDAIERYHQPDLNLRAAAAYLAGKPSAAYVDAAFARLEKYRDQLSKSNYTWRLEGPIRLNGLHERFLALADGSWPKAWNGLNVNVGRMYLDLGHGAEAAKWFSNDIDRKNVNKSHLGYVLCYQMLAARIAKKPTLEPKIQIIRDQLGKNTEEPSTADATIRYVTGEWDRAKVIALPDPDGPFLQFIVGIDEAAHGDLVNAKKDLESMMQKHPEWPDAGGARKLIEWIDKGCPRPESEKTEPEKPANF
jgi:tetratricopeptide (TPR) repeat protein